MGKLDQNTPNQMQGPTQSNPEISASYVTLNEVLHKCQSSTQVILVSGYLGYYGNLGELHSALIFLKLSNFILIYGALNLQGFIKAVLCPLYDTKNLILQLSFETQSSYIFLFVCFCFC